ncbi:MAG TPA: PqqD family protein [Ignavibacteriaceae bacterium]|nr:PqqD family protein [Ignavibacteriaceae bacterium]
MNQYKLQENLAISDSGFLFFPSTGETFTVNELGKLIINNLQAEKSSVDIIRHIIELFDIDQQTAERDFEDYLSQLKNYDLVTEL